MSPDDIQERDDLNKANTATSLRNNVVRKLNGHGK